MKQKAVTTAGLYNLSTGKIKTITFPYVSIEEQDEIVAILDRLYDDNEVIQNNLSNIKEKVLLLKKSILAKAFRGELGTNNAEEESSIELLKMAISKE
jgi:type I restriction enzyme S subunit